MKRGIICVLLFAFVISAAAVSTAVICKQAASLLDALETTSDLLNNKEYAQAAAQAE